MNGHEGNRSAEQVNGDSTRDRDAVSHPEYAETRIRYQQELIDIETFDQRDTDAAQLQSYIHAKVATKLDYNMKLGELIFLFPCPVKNSNHNTTNGLNATRLRKRAAESCILPASFDPHTKETNSNSKKSKTNNNDKNISNNTLRKITRKELPKNTIPVYNPFSVLTIDDNNMEVVGSVENNDNDEVVIQPKQRASRRCDWSAWRKYLRSTLAASKPKFKTAPIKLPPDIRSKILHRNRVRRFWQRSKGPALKNKLRTISNEIASDIRHLSRARWEKTIEELSPETGTLWRRTSFLKKPFHHIPPLKGALGSIAVAPIEKAQVIADSLQKQFGPNTDVENPRFSAHIQRKVQRFLDSPTCMDLEKTSPSEIQGFIKNLKPNKSPGIDLITNRILKNLPTKFIIFIALLFNMLLENCYFPKSWRMAVVIPILKPNSDDSNPQNFRPISLLSSLSKAYEFVILNRLNQHCLAGNIIIPEQHGFVTKCSTVTQLLRVTELVHTGFQNHQSTGMLFVDIAKAFDKIWHDGLISKMMRLGFLDQILKIIHSYLNSREFRVRVENSLSSPRPVKSGIPQGSLLGPRLFNLYINDIPKADNVHIAMYADDTAIISQHTYNFKIIERLQNYITSLQIWLVAWKIKVNASKSASLLFTKQRCIGNLPNIYIFDQPVPWVTEFKYLGFIIDTKLNFSAHIRAALQKVAGMSQTLNCLISRKCKLPIRHKVLLYKLFLRPILLYASPIWASAAVTHLKRLHAFQNKHLRKITNAPWFVRNEILHKDLKIDPILDFIKN
ncbi:RNA-directed DNA polymerase from mobile element jockey [Trichonephila clavipes]|nr:RNA-directed DNA polymerase from mobile element jockey [Trichonephila clavipes]